VRGANTSANEIMPTLWKGRIAFVRGSSGGRVDEVRERERGVVYARRLTAPRSRPSKRLAQISKGRVVELELHRDRLAQIVRRARRGEVRLIDISERSTRRLFAVGIGQLGAQYLAGIGFADGRLMWALDCEGCIRPGIYRYRLS